MSQSKQEQTQTTNEPLLNAVHTIGFTLEPIATAPQTKDVTDNDKQSADKKEQFQQTKLYANYIKFLGNPRNKLNENLENIIQNLLSDFYKITRDEYKYYQAKIEKLEAIDKQHYHVFLQKMIKTVEAIQVEENSLISQQLLTLKLLKNQVSEQSEKQPLTYNTPDDNSYNDLIIESLILLNKTKNSITDQDKSQLTNLIVDKLESSNVQIKKGTLELLLYFAIKQYRPLVDYIINQQFDPQNPNYNLATRFFFESKHAYETGHLIMRAEKEQNLYQLSLPNYHGNSVLELSKIAQQIKSINNRIKSSKISKIVTATLMTIKEQPGISPDWQALFINIITSLNSENLRQYVNHFILGVAKIISSMDNDRCHNYKKVSVLHRFLMAILATCYDKGIISSKPSEYKGLIKENLPYYKNYWIDDLPEKAKKWLLTSYEKAQKLYPDKEYKKPDKEYYEDKILKEKLYLLIPDWFQLIYKDSSRMKDSAVLQQAYSLIKDENSDDELKLQVNIELLRRFESNTIDISFLRMTEKAKISQCLFYFLGSRVTQLADYAIKSTQHQQLLLDILKSNLFETNIDVEDNAIIKKQQDKFLQHKLKIVSGLIANIKSKQKTTSSTLQKKIIGSKNKEEEVINLSAGNMANNNSTFNKFLNKLEDIKRRLENRLGIKHQSEVASYNNTLLQNNSSNNNQPISFSTPSAPFGDKVTVPDILNKQAESTSDFTPSAPPIDKNYLQQQIKTDEQQLQQLKKQYQAKLQRLSRTPADDQPSDASIVNTIGFTFHPAATASVNSLQQLQQEINTTQERLQQNRAALQQLNNSSVGGQPIYQPITNSRRLQKNYLTDNTNSGDVNNGVDKHAYLQIHPT